LAYKTDGFLCPRHDAPATSVLSFTQVARGCPRLRNCAGAGAALGRLGRALEAALAALSNYDRAQAEPGDDAARARPGASARAKLVQDASDALWCFIIQREACGLRDWRLIVHQYGVPAEVQNRMGVFDGGRPRNSSPK
jgi:hypothetical protein